jgi:WD40 repeat protein
VLSEDSEVLSDFTARSFHTPPERRLPSVVWSRLFFDLEPYLTERVAGGASVLGFYHREFGEEAARTFLPGANARARHAALAGYFGRQSLLAANSPAGTPNLRKLEELPYQQARAELWDELVDTLCDLHFVETKCSAGLTYDLLNDYRVALEQLPEAREDRDLEAGRDLRLKEFVGELIAAAEGRTQSLRIIPSVEPWSAERLQAERRRIEKEPTRLDRARAFSDFAGENTDSLVRFGNRPCFCRQQAYNQAASGPVGRAAEQSIAAEPDHVMLVHPDFLRRTTPGRPALLRRLSQQGIHSGLSLAVSGDMQRAVVEADETLQVWDLISGRLLSTLPDPGKPSSRGVSLSADGTRAATWGGNMLRLWDLRSESCALEFTIPSLKPDHDVQVYALALAPDGRKAMLSLTHGRAGHSIGPAVLQLWDLEKGWCLGTFNEAQLFVFGLAMTPDSRLALTATSDDHVLRLWDVRAGRCLREMAGHSHTVWTVSMTPDGRRAISGGYDMKPRVWDLESGLCLFTFNHDENIRRTAITADGLFGLSAGDATLRLWDLRTGACVRKIAEGAPAAALSADGRRALTCGNALQLWDIERGEAYAAVEESAGAFVRVVPAGKRVIVERQGGDVRVLDPGSGKCLSTLDAGAERGHPDSVSIGPGGRRAVSRFAMKYHIWDLEQGRLHCSIAASPFVKNVYVTPDGARAVSVDLQMWSLDSGEELKIPGVHPEYGDEAAIGPGGRAVVSLGRDKKIRTWDLHRRQCRTTIEAPFLSTLPHPLALTPDGRAIVAPVREGDHVVIQAWDIQQGNCLRAIESVSGGYTNTILAMSPDGRRVVTSHMDRPICTWNLRTGACMGTMEACGKFFFGMSITPDGRYLASAHDNSLSVWDLETADRVAQYQAPRGIWGPAWVESSSGYFLVCGSKEGMLLLMAKNMPSGTSAFVTPVRLWLFGEGDTGSWSDRITADCAWCGSRMAVSDPVLDAIHAIGREARLPEGAPPCLNLPSEAWEQPRLRGECPACRRAVRFNPFIADEREFLQ